MIYFCGRDIEDVFRGHGMVISSFGASVQLLSLSRGYDTTTESRMELILDFANFLTPNHMDANLIMCTRR
jgi:hypothetical protein